MITGFRNNREKDFEFFVKNIGKLEPAEFCGLARVLNVPMIKQEKLGGLKKEDYEAMGLDEKTEYVAELTRPMDEVLEQMMDKFLSLPRKRRKEINQILKDVKRGK
jgi:hypothetical protein